MDNKSVRGSIISSSLKSGRSEFVGTTLHQYRQSIFYPKVNTDLLFDITSERLWTELPDEYRISISCKHFFIDGYPPETYIDRLSVTISQALYPLDISIDRNTGAIQVNNIPEIIKRWNILKEKLLTENAGEVFSSYLKKMDEAFKDENVILSGIMTNQIFLNLYIFPLLVNNPLFSKKQSRIFIPSGQYGERFSFDGTCNLEKGADTEESILSFYGEAKSYNLSKTREINNEKYRAEVIYYISMDKVLNDIYADIYQVFPDAKAGMEELFQSIRIHRLSD